VSDETPRWRIVCRGPAGARVVPGRLAQVFFNGIELPGIRDIVVELPIDGVAVVKLEALASDIELEGEFAHVLRLVRDQSDPE